MSTFICTLSRPAVSTVRMGSCHPLQKFSGKVSGQGIRSVLCDCNAMVDRRQFNFLYVSFRQCYVMSSSSICPPFDRICTKNEKTQLQQQRPKNISFRYPKNIAMQQQTTSERVLSPPPLHVLVVISFPTPPRPAGCRGNKGRPCWPRLERANMHIAFYVLPLSFIAKEVHSNISVKQNYRDRSSLVNLTVFLRPITPLDSFFG